MTQRFDDLAAKYSEIRKVKKETYDFNSVILKNIEELQKHSFGDAQLSGYGTLISPSD